MHYPRRKKAEHAPQYKLNDIIHRHQTLNVCYEDVTQKAFDERLAVCFHQFQQEQSTAIEQLETLLRDSDGKQHSDPVFLMLLAKFRIQLEKQRDDASLVEALKETEESLAMEYERTLCSLNTKLGTNAAIRNNYRQVRARIAQLDAYLAELEHNRTQSQALGWG